MERIDLNLPNLAAVYGLRNIAVQINNAPLIQAIKVHLNAYVGAHSTRHQFIVFSTDIKEVLSMSPPHLTVLVDPNIYSGEGAEDMIAVLKNIISMTFPTPIPINVCYDSMTRSQYTDEHVVLLVVEGGFVVLKASGTNTSGKAMMINVPDTSPVVPQETPNLNAFYAELDWVHLQDILHQDHKEIAIYAERASDPKVSPGQLSDYIARFYPGRNITVIYAGSGTLDNQNRAMGLLKTCDVAFEYTGSTIRLVKCHGYDFKPAAILSLGEIVLGLTSVGPISKPEPIPALIDDVVGKGLTHLVVNGKSNTRKDSDTGALFFALTQRLVSIDPKIILNFNGPEEADIIISIEEEFVITKHPKTELVGKTILM